MSITDAVAEIREKYAHRKQRRGMGGRGWKWDGICTLTAAGPARRHAPALMAAEGRHGKNGHSLHHLCLLIEDLVSLFMCDIVKNRELCLFSEEG